jgi:alanyl-tRNA synthetase
VTITGIDRSACGGTHVRATGEIGPILIRKVERVRKQVRLEFMCGKRAVARARADFEILSSLASSSSAAVDDLPGLFEKQRVDLKGLEQARRSLEEELHVLQARELYEAAPPDPVGRRCIVFRAAAATPESCRGLAQAVTGLSKAVFIAGPGSPPTLLVASSADSGIDAGQLLKPVLAEFSGRGGGTARLAQGTIPSGAPVETALARLASAVEASP